MSAMGDSPSQDTRTTPNHQMEHDGGAGNAQGPQPSISQRSGSQGMSYGRLPNGISPGQRPQSTPGGRSGRPEFGQRQARPRVVMPGTSQHTGGLQPVQEQSEDIAPVDDEGEGGTIWGTHINARELQRDVREFLAQYPRQETEAGSRSLYERLVQQAVESGEVALNMDTAHLRAYNPRLYLWLVRYPMEVTTEFDVEVRRIAVEHCGFASDLPREDAQAACTLSVRPYNLDNAKSIRLLDPSDIDQLVTIRGMVTRTSAIIPNLRYATFECASCHAEVHVMNEGGKVEDPPKCAACNKSWCMQLQHNKGLYLDKQLVKVQESPNDIPEGETPLGVSAYAYNELVDVCRPGDRVAITGVYRATPFRVNPRQSTLHALFRTYIDVVHVQRDESRRVFSLAAADAAAAAKASQAAASQLDKDGGHDIASAPGTPAYSQDTQAGLMGGGGGGGTQAAADPMATLGESVEADFVPLETIPADQMQRTEEEIRALSQDPRLMQRLVASLAPNIWEMDDVKKGVLCLMFGGNPKSFPGGKIRGDINVLLVGDPSVSKSQLLTYVHQLAPRGIYTSGKGSSAVGLTAYVSKDPETREMVLESGALVLADRGVCCIDEFDKMSDSARSMLHEAMEQQTVSVAKAGLISTLNARCAIMACANPVGSRYNPQMSIGENINLPPTLLSRFDLIYLMLDKYDEGRDRRLARHLVSLFHPGAADKSKAGEGELIEPELLKRYIAYARARVRPRLTDAAAADLIAKYIMMRRDGRARKVVVATPRQLESLVRLSESLARMRLAEEVGTADVAEAVRLWYGAMSGSAASNEEGGGIDMDNINTGTTAAQRNALQELPTHIAAALAGLAGRATAVVHVDDLQAALAEHFAGSGHSVGRQQLLCALRGMDASAVTFDEATLTVRPAGATRAPLQPQQQQAQVAVA